MNVMFGTCFTRSGPPAVCVAVNCSCDKRRNRNRNVLNIAADFRRRDGDGFQRRARHGRRRRGGHMHLRLASSSAGVIVARSRRWRRNPCACTKPVPARMCDERIVRRQIALDAFRARAFDRIGRNDQRHAGLLGIGIERGLQIAAGNVELRGAIAERSRKAHSAATERRIWSISNHLFPLDCSCAVRTPFSNQREITMSSPRFSTCSSKSCCAARVNTSTFCAGNVPSMRELRALPHRRSRSSRGCSD